MYGLLPNYPEKIDVDLKPVMSLKSIVSHVKTIEEGTSVSYGRTFIANKKMDIATVTIGYADGYPRLLSGKADVLIHGSRCPIVGRICMDQLMVDVSHVKATVRPGDIVTLIGTDENETISADELASLIGTIGYEIVCGISKRVPRIIAQD
jgi:alanine racemase